MQVLVKGRSERSERGIIIGKPIMAAIAAAFHYTSRQLAGRLRAMARGFIADFTAGLTASV
ncbi:MAG: hypothetical protein A4E28_00577 [Methanocella sp. PtaU1.Bin125]|nr:MAG: hypothetical protein A4E28_00577 [Methanocella sp. PtaU1.Bin125]